MAHKQALLRGRRSCILIIVDTLQSIEDCTLLQNNGEKNCRICRPFLVTVKINSNDEF
jgi:hypothetical protein